MVYLGPVGQWPIEEYAHLPEPDRSWVLDNLRIAGVQIEPPWWRAPTGRAGTSSPPPVGGYTGSGTAERMGRPPKVPTSPHRPA